MRRPLIGITCYGRDAANRYSLPVEYAAAVRRAGGLPVMVPPGTDDAAAYLERLDGLVLAGGGDIDPSAYRGTAHEAIYNVDPERDRLELALSKAALQRRLPTLGVCRGAQVINIALGGTLIEHLPDAMGETVMHRALPREPTPHPVQLDPASRLAKILGCTAAAPLSWHHQAIRALGAGLKVVGEAPDGTIEAVELPDHPWLIGVQWHPELTAHEDPAQQRLFDDLVNTAKP